MLYTDRRLIFGGGIALCLIASVITAPVAYAAPSKTVVFGSQPWPGVTVKTEVASQILRRLGYETKITAGTSTVISLGLRKGDIDVLLGNWMPDMKRVTQKNLESGKAQVLATNIKDARLDIVVPDYVWKAGVHSLTDLHRYSDRFKHRIYGIESGNVDNEIVKKAISNNTYQLGNWSLIPSSTAAMMTQVGRKIRRNQWVAFIGWKPHWMNIKYNLRYLDDPEHIFGKSSRVLTLGNTRFIKRHPNVAHFLRQFIVASKTQDKWIYNYSLKKQDKEKVAYTWIKHHKNIVAKWLHGVKTANGSRDAIDALQ